MPTGKGRVVELILRDGIRFARLECPSNLIPTAGQYVLASSDSHDPLPVPLFYTESAPRGFVAAPAPDSLMPGRELDLRGPLGHGFRLPPSARKVALVAFDDSPARLRGLIQSAMKSGAAIVLLCETDVDDLPDEVEIQRLSALPEIIEWADYLALDVSRENLPGLKERLVTMKQARTIEEAEILVRTPIPCGGMAECGVCAVILRIGWKLTCKDGPVFDLNEV